MRTITLDDIGGACSEGLQWFEQNFPNGGEYQVVLDALAKENYIDWAQWLLSRFGHTDAVQEIQDDLTSEASIFFAGRINVKGNIKVKKYLFVGWEIECGEGIKCGWGIECGWGIKCGRGIECGEGIIVGADFGIYVGLHVSISHKKDFAIVQCKEKPQNLLLGEWRRT